MSSGEAALLMYGISTALEKLEQWRRAPREVAERTPEEEAKYDAWYQQTISKAHWQIQTDPGTGLPPIP